MLIATNSLQTPITEELLDRLDSRSRVDFMDSLERITFIQRLISENREYARDKKRDSEGRIIVDLENLHILKDMDYFRERAIHYQKHGVYTHIYPNRAPNSEYRKFWDEERRRCREGYVRESDGEWVPGYYYYYLNYSPIDIVVEDDVIDAHLDDLEANVRASRIEDFPHIWDGDYFFFHYIERAEARGKHGTVLKCRGRGYSFKAAAMLARNYFLIKKSKSFAFASEQEYLLKDGLLTKTWANLNYIDNHTPWSQPRDYADREIHKRASYRDLESKTEKGFMSEIIGVTCKNDPQKGRGKRGKLLVFEESGTFPGLKQTFNIARKSMEQGRSTFGLELTMGTGGTKGADFEAAEEFFYHPNGYNILSLKNIFDKDAPNSECGLFIPEYLNRQGCYDKDGNSDVIKALIEIFIARQLVRNNSSDPNSLVQEKAECIDGDEYISVESLGTGKIKNFPSSYITGKESIYKVKTRFGRELNCTMTHHIYNGEEYKPLANYFNGDRIKILPFVPNKEYQILNLVGKFSFEQYTLKIDEDWGRFIGLFMGDGCFYNSTISFSLDERDTEAIEWSRKFGETIFGSGVLKFHKDRKMVTVNISSVHLKDFLIQMDLIKPWGGNKHGYKRKVHTPDYIMCSPKSVITEYLKGYFDADSGIYTGAKFIKLHCKHLHQLQQVQTLLTIFGINCEIKASDKINGEGRIFRGNSITLKGFEVDLYGEHIGYISKRKQDTLDRWCKTKSTRIAKFSEENYSFDYIKSVEFFKEDTVYNITTEEAYYSVGGIWTHNSPITPQEAVLRVEGNKFPVMDLKELIAGISANVDGFVKGHYTGSFIIGSQGKVDFKFNTDARPIREFPLKDIYKEGAVEIFEMPKPVSDSFRYILGADVFDDDDVKYSTSLGSVIVFDRWTRRIVAEYTGRPQTASEFYEIVYRMSRFYNAMVMYENNKKGLFAYFQLVKKDISILADTPEYLSDKSSLKPRYGNTAKGINATERINTMGRNLQVTWMLQNAYTDTPIEEGEVSKLNLHTIRSIGYIKECIAWNTDINADRVSAMNMVMLFDAELSQYEDGVTRKKAQTRADDPFFKKVYKTSRPDTETGLLERITPMTSFGYRGMKKGLISN